MSAIYLSIRRLLRQLRGKRPRATTRGIFFVSLALLVFGLGHAVLISLIEGWPLADGLWFTATAGTTVGFGDLAPASHLGRLATVFFIYIPAIPAIGYLTSLLVEAIIDRRDKTRLGRLQLMLSSHLVFINFPKIIGTAYFERAVGQFRNSSSAYSERPVAILTDCLPDGLPQSLEELGIYLVSSQPNHIEGLQRACVAEADTVFVLMPSGYEEWEESLVFDIAHQVVRLRGEEARPRVIAEALSAEMKSRLIDMGVDAVVRPIRAYPELIVRAAIAPGSESIVEALFDTQGEECQRLDISFADVPWCHLAWDFMARDLGTPVAIQDRNGVVRSNLQGSERVSGQAVYLIVPDEAQERFEAAKQAVALGGLGSGSSALGQESLPPPPKPPGGSDLSVGET